MRKYEKQHAGFLGKGWAFPPAFDRVQRSALTVAAEHDIKESLYILLTTIPGERVMLPDYGCRVHEHVFDLAGETLFTHLRTLIDHAILYYEPRIVTEAINITMPDQLEGRLYIEVVYHIIQTNTRNNLVIPFYKNGEGTLVPMLEAA
jgi:phage baseplate assembly protein W